MQPSSLRKPHCRLPAAPLSVCAVLANNLAIEINRTDLIEIVHYAICNWCCSFEVKRLKVKVTKSQKAQAQNLL